MAPVNIAIVVGSTRPGRHGAAVARWIQDQSSARSSATYEIVDLEEVALPLLNEAVPALLGAYEHQHTNDWAETVARVDGFVFVTPEYNHSTSPPLLNALNYVYGEWINKAAAFVSYGTSYGVRAVEHLRGVVGELQMADIRNQVRFALPGNFPDRVFTPGPEHDGQATDLFDQLELWAGSPLSARGYMPATPNVERRPGSGQASPALRGGPDWLPERRVHAAKCQRSYEEGQPLGGMPGLLPGCAEHGLEVVTE